MKFLKGLFPSGKKTIGTILMVAGGILVYNIVNRKTGIESRISSFIPDSGGQNQNMRRAG